MLKVLATAALIMLAPATRAADVPVWRHGIIQPKSDAGFALMPADPRFAGPQGVDIQITPVQSDQVGLKAMLAGELDSFEGAPNSAIVAGAHGADIRIIGCAWPSLVHGIFVNGDVHSLADLKGRNVAISAPGSMPDFMIRAALKGAGLTPGDVRFASLGSDTDRFKALSAGVVSGAVISSEYIPIAPPGVRQLVAGRELMPQFLRGCVVTTGATLAKKRDTAVRFMAAELAGVRHAVDDRADELAVTDKATHADPADPRAGFLFDEAVKHGDIDPAMPVPADKVAWLGQLLLTTGILKTAVDTGPMLDPTVRADALKQLGGAGG